eukprot:sb/3478644/
MRPNLTRNSLSGAATPSERTVKWGMAIQVYAVHSACLRHLFLHSITEWPLVMKDLMSLPQRSCSISIQPGRGVGLPQEPTDISKHPIRTRYLGHVTGY